MVKRKTTQNGSVKYSVPDYLAMLRLSKRSDATIKGYYKVFQSYAKFLKVPVDEVHHHLSVSNLLKYADSRNKKSANGNKTTLNVLRRYFTQNGIVFDELEYNATNPKVTKEHNDKPLTIAMLQAMMDLTDVHGKSMLSFLISTGLRAGEFSQLLLSDIGRLEGDRFVPDISGDVVNVRNEIAKGGHGGCVYLTSEAREYLTLWMKVRNEYIADIDKKALNLVNHGAHQRPKNDQRIFGTGYSALRDWFTRLYEKVDNEKGKYHNLCTLHSCRKYFRTAAAQSMHPDLVTNIMRQTAYLDNTYVRIEPSKKYREFKEREAALYITRADHRIQGGKLSDLEQKNKELVARLAAMEDQQRAIDVVNSPANMAEIMKRMDEMQRELAKIQTGKQ